MHATKKTGRVLGLLFALSILLGVAGTFNRGLSGLSFESTDVINTIIERVSKMKTAMFLDVLGSAVSLFISVFLYRYVKSVSKVAATIYILLGVGSFVLVVLSNWIHWNILSIAMEVSDGSSLVEMSILFDRYYDYHFSILLIYSVVNYILFYFMWKTKWIPIWMTFWGVAASLLVTYGATSNLAGFSPPFLVFLQNGIFMITFTLWLLIAGFKTRNEPVPS